MKANYLCTICLSALFCCAETARAQDQSTTPVPNAGLSEIVVTAQRKVENAQRAGIAIDVVSARDLVKTGSLNAQSLNAAAPALVVTQLGGPNTSFFVRGVGNFTANAYSDPAIAFSLDGVYLGRATSTAGTFYDLERVEVLKGPQGTLYGRNATGGAVNVLPNKPVLNQLSGYLSAGYGNYNAVDLEAAINAPLGENTALRIAGKFSKHDGYNTDGTDDLNNKAVRIQILMKPTDNLSIRIGADYSYVGGLGAGMNYTGSEVYTPGAPASGTSPANYVYAPANLPNRLGLLAPASRDYFSGLVVGGPFVHPGPVATPYQSNNYSGIYGDISLRTGLGTLTVIPAYRSVRLKTLFNGPSFAGALLNDKNRQFSLEARFAGKRVGPVEWLIGGYYFNENIDAIDTYSQYLVQNYQTFSTGTKSLAGFGRITLNATDRLRFIGGLRYTHDAKHFNGSADTLLELCHNSAPPFCIGGPSVPVATSLADISAKLGLNLPLYTPVEYGNRGNFLLATPYKLDRGLNADKATYRFAMEYDVAPRVLAYASYETGYRSGGYSLAPGYETYRPETLNAATVGIKSRFWHNRAQINLELFHWTYHNQQVAHFGIDALGGSNLFTENIGQATIKGFDLDSRLMITPTTLLTGSVQYLDSVLDSFIYTAAGGSNNPPPATSCTVTPNSSTYTVNCSGKPESNSPKWSINLSLEKTFSVGNYKITANGSARYRSNRNTGFEYLPQQQTGSDTLFDAGLTFAPISGKWEIAAYIRNIGNVKVANITQFLAANGNTVTTQYAPPRTFGANLRVKF